MPWNRSHCRAKRNTTGAWMDRSPIWSPRANMRTTLWNSSSLRDFFWCDWERDCPNRFLALTWCSMFVKCVDSSWSPSLRSASSPNKALRSFSVTWMFMDSNFAMISPAFAPQLEHFLKQDKKCYGSHSTVMRFHVITEHEGKSKFSQSQNVLWTHMPASTVFELSASTSLKNFLAEARSCFWLNFVLRPMARSNPSFTRRFMISLR